MKKILLFILASLVNYMACAQNWEWLNPKPQGNHLYASYFIDNNIGYVAGQFGTLLKTLDGGVSWISQLIPDVPDPDLHSAYFLNTSEGFVISNFGVYKTIDGGTSWDYYSPGGVPIHSIYFTSHDTGFITGNNGSLYRSSDFGQTWFYTNTGTNEDLFDICFSSQSVGLCVGSTGKIIKTTNQGSAWTTLNSGTVNNLRSVCFSNDSTPFITGDSGTILKSINTGQTWTNISSATILNLSSITFINQNFGFVAGDSGIIMKTNNGGLSWTRQASGTSNNLTSILFTDSLIGYAFGVYGTMLKTMNGGNTWNLLSTSVTVAKLNNVNFPDENTGYAVGYNGTIIKTNNAGSTWNLLNSGTTYKLNSLFFTDPDTGFVAGDYGQILKTVNGGSTWLTQSFGDSVFFQTVTFPSAKIGYALASITGTSGFSVYKTTDAGFNWNLISSVGDNFHATSMHFGNNNSGYVVGEFATLYKTTNGGMSWASTSNLLEHENSVFMVDSVKAFSVGWVWDSQGGFISGEINRTLNGSWWTNEIIADYPLNSIFMVNNATGCTVGNMGYIFTTIDQGDTWHHEPRLTNNNFFSVFCTSSFGAYVVGNGGTILKKTNGGVSVQDAKHINQLTLYPNPVSNHLIIAFNDDKKDISDLYSIYSLQGVEFFCPVSSGTQMEINVSALPAGIYFLRIINNNQVHYSKFIKR